jgi:hypothetical protein
VNAHCNGIDQVDNCLDVWDHVPTIRVVVELFVVGQFFWGESLAFKSFGTLLARPVEPLVCVAGE